MRPAATRPAAAPGAGGTVLRLATRELPPARRAATWQAVAQDPLARRVLSPPWLTERPFDVEMTARELGRTGEGARAGACVVRMAVSAGGMARRTPELIGDGNDDVILHIHAAGRRSVAQLGREATVEPGTGLLTSNAEAATILLPGPARFVSVAVPRSVLGALVPAVEDALVRPLPPQAGVLHLLMRYLDILDEAPPAAPELQQAVATHLQDLLALAVGAGRDAAELAAGRGLRAARLQAVKADIAARLPHGDVSAAALARRQGVTARYIHKLFEAEGATLSQVVRALRLAQVHRALLDPRNAGRAIGTLAYDAGFGDLSTFNREFRRRFGATPSEVRAAARRGPADP